MLNFTRPERPAAKEPDARSAAPRSIAPVPATPTGSAPPANAASRPASAPVPDHAASAAATAPAADTTPSRNGAAERRLTVGPDINLKGVEISNCDALVIEGNVDATVHSKVMEILAPGRLNGTATIDVAEIHGAFEGELTARTRLVVHGTGRVTGTIRYGSLVVADGGSLTGELTRIEPAAAPGAATVAATAHAAALPGSRSLLGPQP